MAPTARTAPHREEHLVIELVKAHGTGNDFVLLPDRLDQHVLDVALTVAVCDRRFGIGGDGAIRVAPARADTGADVFMDYRNADGSLAEMCGNGVRCVAKLALDRGWVDGDEIAVDTRAGVKQVTVTERHDDGTVATVRVHMGSAHVGQRVEVDVSPLTRARAAPGSHAGIIAEPPAMPGEDAAAGAAVTAEHRTLEVLAVSMGNPHAVVVVGSDPAALDAVPLAAWSAAVAAHPAFPDGANVEAVAVPDPATVHGRIHERGSGETLASGTGASAMAVAAAALGHARRASTVRLPGGDLRVDWREDGEVTVTGPAETVATGTLDPGWLARATASSRRSAPAERELRGTQRDAQPDAPQPQQPSGL